MALEKKWSVVSPQAFTADGTTFGLVNLTSTAGFKVKQSAYLGGPALLKLAVQVKRVISPTQLIVGAIDNKIASWKPLDISAYTLALNAYIGAEEQDKNRISPEDILQAIYEADPTIGLRQVPIDQFGQFIDSVKDINGINRLAVDAAVSVTGVTVDLDAFTKIPPDNVIVVGTEDGTKTGVKHALKIGADGKAEVKDTAADASLASIDGKLIDLHTTPVQTVQIFTKPFDSITATYPLSTQEVYKSRVGGVAGTVQETVTVNYTDSTKNLILNVART